MLEPLENTSEQDEEFRLLQSQYVAAAKRALRAAMTVGLSSTDFRDAEKEAALATLRIEEILARSSRLSPRNNIWRLGTPNRRSHTRG